MTPLQQLIGLGTSVWIDGLPAPVELQRLMSDGVTGLTSNPTIFRAALLDGGRHTARLARLRGRSPLDAYEAIAVADVQAAADVLAPVFARTRGADGFVSLEVAPELAHDPTGTLTEVRRLWARVNRPNAMIKVPGTAAGVEATYGAIADGINVNVTLLFSVERYTAVIDAYIAGLEERLRRGQPVTHVSSVASFFVSRVDTAIDRLLADRGREDLAGRAGVANARLAFAHATARFSGSSFAALQAAGARPQRPLWASTGTKDRRYSDVKYVEELAGPGTVSTMPPATLAAFRDHGVAQDRLTGSGREAQATLDQLACAGVDLDAVTGRLLADGVAGFAASMRELLDGLRDLQQSPSVIA